MYQARHSVLRAWKFFSKCRCLSQIALFGQLAPYLAQQQAQQQGGQPGGLSQQQLFQLQLQQLQTVRLVFCMHFCNFAPVRLCRHIAPFASLARILVVLRTLPDSWGCDWLRRCSSRPCSSQQPPNQTARAAPLTPPGAASVRAPCRLAACGLAFVRPSLYACRCDLCCAHRQAVVTCCKGTQALNRWHPANFGASWFAGTRRPSSDAETASMRGRGPCRLSLRGSWRMRGGLPFGGQRANTGVAA